MAEVLSRRGVGEGKHRQGLGVAIGLAVHQKVPACDCSEDAAGVDPPCNSASSSVATAPLWCYPARGKVHSPPPTPGSSSEHITTGVNGEMRGTGPSGASSGSGDGCLDQDNVRAAALGLAPPQAEGTPQEHGAVHSSSAHSTAQHARGLVISAAAHGGVASAAGCSDSAAQARASGSSCSAATTPTSALDAPGLGVSDVGGDEGAVAESRDVRASFHGGDGGGSDGDRDGEGAACRGGRDEHALETRRLAPAQRERHVSCTGLPLEDGSRQGAEATGDNRPSGALQRGCDEGERVGNAGGRGCAAREPMVTGAGVDSISTGGCIGMVDALGGSHSSGHKDGAQGCSGNVGHDQGSRVGGASGKGVCSSAGSRSNVGGAGSLGNLNGCTGSGCAASGAGSSTGVSLGGSGGSRDASSGRGAAAGGSGGGGSSNGTGRGGVGCSGQRPVRPPAAAPAPKRARVDFSAMGSQLHLYCFPLPRFMQIPVDVWPTDFSFALTGSQPAAATEQGEGAAGSDTQHSSQPKQEQQQSQHQRQHPRGKGGQAERPAAPAAAGAAAGRKRRRSTVESQRGGAQPTQPAGRKGSRPASPSSSVSSAEGSESHSERRSPELAPPLLLVTGASHETSLEESALERDLSCPICLDILRSPMATECLHRFCSDCIETALRVGRKECPTCRKPVATRRALRRDTNVEALVLRLFPDAVVDELRHFSSLDRRATGADALRSSRYGQSSTHRALPSAAAAAATTTTALGAGYLADRSQCERNPLCTRGFKHRGRGGVCSKPHTGENAVIKSYNNFRPLPLRYEGQCEKNPQCIRGFRHGGKGGNCSCRLVPNPGT